MAHSNGQPSERLNRKAGANKQVKKARTMTPSSIRPSSSMSSVRKIPFCLTSCQLGNVSLPPSDNKPMIKEKMPTPTNNNGASKSQQTKVGN